MFNSYFSWHKHLGQAHLQEIAQQIAQKYQQETQAGKIIFPAQNLFFSCS